MPLSKKRMRERKRADRVKPDTYIGWRDKEPQPKTLDVKPKDDALQSISRGIKRETYSTAPSIEEAINRGTLVIPYRKASELLSAANLVNRPDGRDKGG